MSGHGDPIISLQNPRVKALVKLRQRRVRDGRKLTLIEEPLVIRRALAAGYPLQEVWWSPEIVDADLGAAKLADLLAELRAAGITLVAASAPVLDKISYRRPSEGIVVVAPQKTIALEDIRLRPSPLVVVLVAVEKPGNLGAILRIADGAGADAVLVCEEGTDLFNPNVLRASRGALFSLPTATCATPEVWAFLRQHGLTSIATAPAAQKRYTDADLRGPTALIVGAEHEGLDPAWMERCDIAVQVPMLGAVDSLNVAATTAVVLYEALRQRQAKP